MQRRFLIRLILTSLCLFALGYSMGYYHAAKEAKVRVSFLVEKQ